MAYMQFSEPTGAFVRVTDERDGEHTQSPLDYRGAPRRPK
jgi:hypothetical protein